MSSDVTHLGITNGRYQPRPFGIRQRDRFFHTYVIGATGTGKTTLLEGIALQDINHGRGLAVLDPHGDLAERLVRLIPHSRLKDLVYFNAPDRNQPFGYNPLRRVSSDR